MATYSSILLLTISVQALLLTTWAGNSYIVYMGSHQEQIDPELVAFSHYNMLSSVLGSEEAAKSSIFYSYKHCINGFAAHLERDRVSAISAMAGVLGVFPNRLHTLHTTRSWEFLGLETNGGGVPAYSLWEKADYGRDVIIGVLDTGVWPESESYNDDGMGPIPSRWKGICESGANFSASDCNRKLIGARYFVKGYEAENGPLNLTATGDFLSPRDKEGHGTHTSSTAGGRFVQNASIFGFAEGTAKGGAPLSRIAAYKVCWTAGCSDADILAAFDAGINDGVDVFSLSLGSSPPLPALSGDAIAIASFHAVRRGKSVVCSAGNDGPKPASVANVAPWIFTIAASSIDRDFPSDAVLGNNKKIKGASLSEFKLENKLYPLVTGTDVGSPNANSSASKLCFPGSLDPKKTQGKIVACVRGINPRVEKGAVVEEAGGAGMILCNAPTDADEILADPHILPATQVSATDGDIILKYINDTKSPLAYITPATTLLNAKPAPVLAAFSSQGPNSLIPDILKPDITAPGLNILAAWTEASAPTASTADHRIVKYNVISGTSMSCPHVAGLVALVKALHPDWSPAAIKSALMTTAAHMGNDGGPLKNGSLVTANPLNYGSGHVHPNRAADPGLIYDLDAEDYFLFLCNLNYNASSMRLITEMNTSCPPNPPKVADLNYPSVSLSNLTGSETVTRTVTNVGGKGTYEVVVRQPPGVRVSIAPKKLEFLEVGEKKRFKIRLKVRRTSGGKYVFGHFTWTDGKHSVRSPIAVNATSIYSHSNA